MSTAVAPLHLARFAALTRQHGLAGAFVLGQVSTRHHQLQQRAADGFLGAVPKQALGARVPLADHALRRDHDDAVVRGVHDGRPARLLQAQRPSALRALGAQESKRAQQQGQQNAQCPHGVGRHQAQPPHEAGRRHHMGFPTGG